jgi:hypothetical protein
VCLVRRRAGTITPTWHSTYIWRSTDKSRKMKLACVGHQFSVSRGGSNLEKEFLGKETKSHKILIAKDSLVSRQ